MDEHGLGVRIVEFKATDDISFALLTLIGEYFCLLTTRESRVVTKVRFKSPSASAVPYFK